MLRQNKVHVVRVGLRSTKWKAYRGATYLRKDKRIVSIVLSRDQLEKMGRAL